MNDDGSKLRFHFRPKLLDSLQGYSRANFSNDLMAGLTVGIGALPLVMASAVASGLKPEIGSDAAIIGGFFVSLPG